MCLTSLREKTERDVIDRIKNQVKESIIFMLFEQSRYFACKLNFGYVGQKDLINMCVRFLLTPITQLQEKLHKAAVKLQVYKQKLLHKAKLQQDAKMPQNAIHRHLFKCKMSFSGREL